MYMTAVYDGDMVRTSAAIGEEDAEPTSSDDVHLLALDHPSDSINDPKEYYKWIRVDDKADPDVLVVAVGCRQDELRHRANSCIHS